MKLNFFSGISLKVIFISTICLAQIQAQWVTGSKFITPDGITATTIIRDDLQGSTDGSQIGGSFNSEGYKPGTGTNHILYNPSQIIEGYVEFEVKGFDHNLLLEDDEHGFLILYDGRGISEPISYSNNFRENYFRWNLHWRQNKAAIKSVIACAEPTSARLNSNYAVYNDSEGRDWYEEPTGSGQSWNVNNWYTFKIEWKDKSFKVFIDGVLKWSADGPYDYAPIDFKIWLGSGTGKYDSDLNNVVYRNFKLISYDSGSSDFLSVTPSNQIVNSDNGSTTFSVASNISWSVTDDADWIVISPASGSGNSILTASYEENMTAGSRLANINISNGSITRAVIINQEEPLTSDYLNVTPATSNINSDTQSVLVTVVSDLSWTVDNSETWINVTPISGTGNSTLNVAVDENTTTLTRTGEIFVASGEISKTISISQAGQGVDPYLNVSPDDQVVSSDAGSTFFNVSSNVEWSVSDNASWLSKKINGNTVEAIYQENTSINTRVADIAISGGSLKKVVTVSQVGSSAFLDVTPSGIILESDADTSSFIISSNIDWNISKKSDWISFPTTSGNGTAEVKFVSKVNRDTAFRIDTISIVGGGMTKEISIIQNGSDPYLDISASIANFADITSSSLISIISNIDWIISKDVNWISLSTSVGSGDSTISCEIEANQDTIVRTGNITISGDTLSKVLKITQFGKESFTIEAIAQPIEGGNVSGYGVYIVGDEVSLIPLPNSGWEFVEWLEDSASISEDSVFTFIVESSKLFVARFSLITLVDEEIRLNDIPTEYNLANNYPNPFNPSTIIEFSLPQDGFTELIIYNSLGQGVRKILSTFMNKGNYKISFNGKGLSSGIYFYSLNSGKFIHTKKMLLIE